MGQRVCQRGAIPPDLAVKKRRKLLWGLLLVFIFSCLGSAVLMPQKAEAKTIVDTRSGVGHTVILYDDGTVEATGSDDYGQCGVNGASNVAAIGAAGY
jgi:hypothetical protein